MVRTFTIFWLFSKNALKIGLTQGGASLYFLAGKILRFVLFVVFITQLFRHTNTLAGYTLQQTLIFFLTFTVIDTLTQLLFREVYRFRPLVISGELSGILIKPYHPFLRVLVGGIDILDAVLFIPYVVMLSVLIAFESPSVGNVILYGMLFVNGLLIATGFHILVLASGILTTEVDHMIMMYRDLTRLGTMPIDIYREPFRFIITFVIPIGLMISAPAQALVGLILPATVVFSFLLSILWMTISLIVWRVALQKYQGWGG